MESSDLDVMIEDFLKRNRGEHSKEEIKRAMSDYFSLVSEDGFFVFDISGENFTMFFSYVKPGKDARKYWEFFESYAKFMGCKKTMFCTRRDKAFERYFPDYKRAGVVFEKIL